MRFLLSIALAGFFAAAPVSASEVLLPPSNGPSPNLGLAPVAPPPAAPAVTDTPKTQPAPAVAPSPAITGDLMYTPIPESQGPSNKSAGLPTTVIHVPDFNKMMAGTQNGQKFSHSLSIDLSDKSVWGPGDTASVGDTLGIPQNQVAANCHMGVSGVMITDKTPMPFSTSGALHGSINYNGNVRNIILKVEAQCHAASLPPDKGYIQQMGDYYIVPLGVVPCTPEQTGAPQQLTVIYAGNSNGQCQFR